MTKAPTVRIEAVTPALADKYLGSQLANRTLREGRVEYWCGVIERGEWRLSNDALAFDIDGHLINGQHRLTALVVTGVSLPFIVVRNLPNRTQDIMDAGLKRSASDALKLRGEISVTSLAAALRWELRMRRIEAANYDPVAASSAKEASSTPLLLALFEEDPDGWRAATAYLNQHVARLHARPGPTIVLWRRLGAINAEHRDAFFEALETGAGLARHDPILQLRTILANNRLGRGHSRMADYREVALMIKAWNLWREGDRRSHLVWHYGATAKENFPEAR